MANQNYYQTLGVDRKAGAEDIKKAYRKLAMRYHPDRNPDDKASEKAFKDINEAYDILKDDGKRAAYDQYGHAVFDNDGARPAGFDFNFTSGFADIFDEMFGEFMGGRRGTAASGRGADMRYNLKITLEEAFRGKQARIIVPTSVTCESCAGTGGEGGVRPVLCSACHGQGKVRTTQGFLAIERTCPTCRGSGRVIEVPCGGCRGSGRVRKKKRLSVDIPAGVEEGTRIRLAGEGQAGVRGAPPGDLYIFLTVAPHRLFQRDGASIYCRIPIPMVTATLGGTIEVPTVDGGRARVTIPPGTQTGQRFRLRGKGMSVLNSNRRGDMYIQASAETPVNLSKRQKELLQEFERAGGARPTSPESEGFFAKVKEMWEDSGDSKE